MIYLDAAATTFQKPRSVHRAVQRAMDTMTTPGRGGYGVADAAAQTLFQCRAEAAALFGVPSEENVIFTLNATHALNIAIKSIVEPGDTVVVSGYEHNAVMRPLRAIGGGVTLRIARGALFDSGDMVRAFAALLTPEVKAAVCTHVSNVFGYCLPIEEIGALCRARNIPLIVDASQSAGILPVRLGESAFVAMPGHKGLYGPQGTGLLLCNYWSKPLIEGGTGSQSALPDMPPYLPDRLEAGTQNVPGIAGLLEGLRFVRRRGTDMIGQYETALTAYLVQELRGMERVRLYTGTPRSGVLSFCVKGMESEALAAALAEHEIAVRAGLHCAPLAHETVGTMDTGTVRVSVSLFNTERELDAFLRVLRRILA